MNARRLFSVLLVEDSRFVRARLRRLLEESDTPCVVMEARSVTEAVKAMQSLKPDAVVLDLNLPDGTGFDLLPKIKKAAPRSVAILLTNHEGPAIRKRAMGLGADYYFRKSTEFELVVLVMQRVADAVSSERASNPESQ